ncbi:hypothetical protein B566_EDAN015953, partial [Ephemera danica]
MGRGLILHLLVRIAVQPFHQALFLHNQHLLLVCGHGNMPPVNQGNIKSPGSPDKYPQNRDCEWKLRVPTGKRIQMHIFTLMLETHENCSFDFIRIYDGGSNTDPLLREFCTTSQPSLFFSSGQEVIVHFHSDDKSSDYGFQMTYTASPGVAGCGGVWTDLFGEITSPNYPRSYPGNLYCEYLIQLPQSQRIKVTFEDLQLQSAQSCAYDYIQIREGSTEDSPLVGTYCGSDQPTPYTSIGNELLIVFHTDATVTTRGFKLKYKRICGGIFTAPTGAIWSMNYPNNYPHSIDCVYEISLPLGMAVSLQFQDFEMEAEPSCVYDSLEIRDGDQENSKLIGTYCNHMPPVVVSTFNHLRLRLKTDISVPHRGFHANYTALNIRCGGILRNNSGIINTALSTFFTGDDCSWIISAPAGKVIRLNWNSFTIQMSNEQCEFESVTVFDNSSTTPAGLLMGRYCSSITPPTFTTIGNLMTIKLKSVSRMSSFSASYTFVPISQICGGTYYVSSGVLRSPLYPSQYPHNLHCVWVIEVPVVQKILLNITDFELEADNNCQFDYLEIRNGGSALSPLIGQFCGNSIPRTITSFSQSLYLLFHTDLSVNRKGFSINWDGAATGCGGRITSPTGTIHSPNYPNSYVMNMECYWKIVVSRGSLIQLIIVDLDLEHEQACKYDYIEIREGSTEDSPLVGTYCGSDQPTPYTSIGNELLIVFHTDATVTTRGFKLKYKRICGGIFTAPTGAIWSMNYPNNYPHSIDCVYEISLPLGMAVSLQFQDFEMEAEPSCVYDSLEIRDGDQENSKLIGTYCNHMPPVVVSTFNHLRLRLKTDISVPHRGFHANYTALNIRCGGILRNNSGIINTALSTFFTGDDCSWIISAPAGKVIRLNWNSFTIQMSNEQCEFESVTVFDNSSTTPAGLLMGRYCSSITPPTFTTIGNLMTIKLKSVSRMSSFSASYTFVPISQICGGTYYVSSGVLRSPLYPSQYPHNLHCVWVIEVPVGQKILLNITDFELEADNNCQFDYLEIRNGGSALSPLIGQFCGNSIPRTITSFSQSLYLLFHTDLSVNRKGFSINWDGAATGCGGRITSPTGTIHSPNYPNSYVMNMECYWKIVVSRGSLIQLIIVDLDLEHEQACKYDYIELRDGPSATSPIIGQFCQRGTTSILTTTQNFMWIKFRADESRQGRGFNLQYET